VGVCVCVRSSLLVQYGTKRNISENSLPPKSGHKYASISTPHYECVMNYNRTGDVSRNIEARSRNHSCLGKVIRSIYSERVPVALVIQHAKRMRRIILSPVTCLALPHFSTLSDKLHDCRGERFIEHKIYVLTFSATFLEHVSERASCSMWTQRQTDRRTNRQT
jgi:hypothetical protein